MMKSLASARNIRIHGRGATQKPLGTGKDTIIAGVVQTVATTVSDTRLNPDVFHEDAVYAQPAPFKDLRQESPTIGLPKDMMEMLDSLEAIAALINALPRPPIPERISRTALQAVSWPHTEMAEGDIPSTLCDDSSASYSPEPTRKGDSSPTKCQTRRPHPSAKCLPSSAESHWATPLRSLPSRRRLKSDPTVPATITASRSCSTPKLPKLWRANAARAASSPVPVSSPDEMLFEGDRKAAHFQGRILRSMRSLGGGGSALDVDVASASAASPKRFVLRSILRPRLSEPLPQVQRSEDASVSRPPSCQ